MEKHKVDPNYCLVVWVKEKADVCSFYFCTAPYTLSEVLNFCNRMPDEALEQSLKEYVALSTVCFKHIEGKQFDLDADPLLALMACKIGQDHLIYVGYGTLLGEHDAIK